MTNEIIIKGNFTIEGVPLKNVSQPLKYIKLQIGYPSPLIRVDSFSSIEEKKGKISKVKHINSPQDFSQSSGENDASGERRSPLVDTKPKCTKCGVYKEVHGTIKSHDFVEEKNVTQ